MLMVATRESYKVSKTARKADLLQTRCSEPTELLGQNTAGLSDYCRQHHTYQKQP